MNDIATFSDNPFRSKQPANNATHSRQKLEGLNDTVFRCLFIQYKKIITPYTSQNMFRNQSIEQYSKEK